MQSQTREMKTVARRRGKRRSPRTWMALLVGALAFAGLGYWVFSLEQVEPVDAVGGAATSSTLGSEEQAADASTTTIEAPTTTVAAPTTTTVTDSGDDAPATADLALLTVALDDPLDLTAATAGTELRMDPNTGEICYTINIDGMESPYDGHIHVGPPGVKGGIVVDLGALTGTNPTGCLPNSPIDTQSILADLGGHYVEFHDPDGSRTIRAQLAMVDPAVVAETADDGAVIVIEDDLIRFVGDVPDQVTIDKLIESFADIDLGSTTIDTSELTITPGSPRPSGRILVDTAVIFDVDSNELPDTELPVIDTLARIFQARPAWQLAVVGHTDDTGTAVYNLELSLRRAGAVRAALESRGVPTGSLKVEGAGSTNPIASNETPEGRARNRRIEFVVQTG